ncbi:hypothetical protein DVVG_00007 [Dunaliella viridis virus SI2]|uniref:hypothetical protein n=1 Tax=Dunaliella viridis virus SI2 TaxID=754069 RepID=UPI0002C0E3EF|nr:hypothetical protein DVVG_00007 [Dunaliella viridis virus SI2]AGH15993.1 hypothetical protein DVVG_00007 [Dunaliella viridis virus SI2]
MAEVRRYSRSVRTVTDVQPTYTPAAGAQAETFAQVRSGLQAGIDFLRPAVEQEQTVRGEAEALEAYEANSFEMRSPFSIRDAAFNETGGRLVTNRAMMELDEAVREAVREAGTSMTRLDANMQEIRGRLGELPQVPGLSARWLETYERGLAGGRRVVTARAQAAAAAAHRRAGRQALEVAERGIQTAALTAGSADDVAAAVTEGFDEVVRYGPRGAFTVNGVEYGPDPTRSGLYTADQLSQTREVLTREANTTFLRADLERSEAPGEWVREFEREVLSGNVTWLAPDQALDMLNTFESQARTEEADRVRAETAVQRDLAEAAEERLNPYMIALENGVMASMPQEERDELLTIVGGNPELSQQVQTHLAAADAVVAMSGMGQADRVRYIEDLQQQFVDTPGISAEEAAIINTLAPYLTAARSAITAETVGVTAAERLLNSGGMLSEENIAEMRVAAAGNPTAAQSVDVLADAMTIIQSGEGMTGDQRQAMIDTLETQIARLGTEGGNVGAAAARRLDALDMAADHFTALEEMASSDPVRMAALTGVALTEFPSQENATLPEVAAVIVERVGQISERSAQLGVDTPVPLSQMERELISDWMRDTNNASRIAFMEHLSQGLPRAHAQAILEDLGQDNPPLMAAGHVQASNPAAARAILAGLGATVLGDTPTNRTIAEAPFLPLFNSGMLHPDEMDAARETAIAYARGMAVREGQTEISPHHITEGLDIHFGADADGNGGREDVGHFGVTILPTGMRGRDVEDALRGLDNQGFLDLTGNRMVRDRNARVIMPAELFTGRARNLTVTALMPVDGRIVVPVDAEGGIFLLDDGTPFTIDLEVLMNGQ